MKLRASRPSPAMCVACVALFIALGGTSVAAVSYARNAGKVDGKDAVASSASAASAAGNLVATASRGPDRGKLPGRLLADVAGTQAFGRSFEVADNAVGAQEPFAVVPGAGTLTANCADQNARPGIEDPISSVQFANQSGATINVTRVKGTEAPAIEALANGTVSALTVGGSNTFEFQIQNGATNLLIAGTVRQDGRGQAAAFCLVYGTVLTITQ